MTTGTYYTLIPLFDELRSERIIVRPYCESNAQALQEAVAESRDHLRPWMPFADAHQTVEESRDWILHQVAQWVLREDMIVGIWEAATNRFLGGSGLDPRNWETRYFEIGYWIRTSAEGLLTVAKFIYLLSTIPIFFDPLTFSRLFESNRPKKRKGWSRPQELFHCLFVIERRE